MVRKRCDDLCRAADAGVDIVDAAFSALAGGTSQPSMNSFYYAMSGKKNQPQLNIQAAEEMSRYWASVRPYYKGVDKGEPFPTQKSMTAKCQAASSQISSSS